MAADRIRLNAPYLSRFVVQRLGLTILAFHMPISLVLVRVGTVLFFLVCFRQQENVRCC